MSPWELVGVLGGYLFEGIVLMALVIVILEIFTGWLEKRKIEKQEEELEEYYSKRDVALTQELFNYQEEPHHDFG